MFLGVFYMNVQEIREIIKLINQSEIEEFICEQDGSKIELKKTSSQIVQEPLRYFTEMPQLQQSTSLENLVQEPRVENTPDADVKTAEHNAADQSNLHKIVSPMVGTFYKASSPDSDPYVSVGSVVSTDSIVCIVEAMKLFNEIEAEIDGEIVEVLVKEGELVEYGQPLFLIKPR
jgi:acetyl-CoA carboxylase biotin carboxyl carrier protein